MRRCDHCEGKGVEPLMDWNGKYYVPKKHPAVCRKCNGAKEIPTGR